MTAFTENRTLGVKHSHEEFHILLFIAYINLVSDTWETLVQVYVDNQTVEVESAITKWQMKTSSLGMCLEILRLEMVSDR